MKEQQLKSNGYVPALTLLRGLAALMVVGFHFFNKDLGFYQAIKNFFSYGFLGLDLFFLISGFVLPYAMYQKKYQVQRFFRFLLKRLVRIEPPYVISFVMVILVRIVHCEVNDYMFEMNWSQFWTHFLYLNQYFGHEGLSVVYWTLAIEFQFYLIIGLTYPLFMHRSKIIRASTIIIFSILCFWVNVPYNWFIFQYGFLFLLGIFTFQFYVKFIQSKEYSLLSMLAVIGIYKTLGLPEALVAVFGIATIFYLQKSWKISDFFGNISYSLYLTHTEAAGWFIVFTSSYFTDKLTQTIIAVMFAILFATVYHRWIEKPFLSLSKKVKY